MKQTVNKSDFHDAFRAMGRQHQFCYRALCALFDYLEELEQETMIEWELDVIALCCEWTEYSNALEACEDYTPTGIGEGEPDEAAALDWLRDQTTVIEFDGGIVIQDF